VCQVTFSKLKFPQLKFIIKRFVLVNQIVNYVFSALFSLGAAGNELKTPDVAVQFVRSCEKLKKILHRVKDKRDVLHTLKRGKLTELVTSCIETVF